MLVSRSESRTLGDDTGASSVEYGLIVFAIAALIVVILFAFGGVVIEMFQDSCDTVGSTATSTTC